MKNQKKKVKQQQLKNGIEIEKLFKKRNLSDKVPFFILKSVNLFLSKPKFPHLLAYTILQSWHCGLRTSNLQAVAGLMESKKKNFHKSVPVWKNIPEVLHGWYGDLGSQVFLKMQCFSVQESATD